MRIFTDVFSDDEILADKFPIEEVDDIVYEVDCQITKITPDVHADSEDEVDLSEEEHDSQDDDTITADNLVRTFQLQETGFDKKQYMAHLKGYMTSIKNYLSTTNPDRVQAFQEASTEYVKKIAHSFSSFRFWTGASLDLNGMVVLSGYREDGVTQYFIFWKDGLRTTNR